MLKYLRLFSISIIALIGFISCATVKEESTKIKGNITIDASLDDWDVPLNYYSKEGIRAGFKNDNENLYIAIMVHDQNVIGQIKMTGLELWIDDKGGADKKIGLRYPIGLAKSMREPDMSPPDRNNERGEMPEMSFDINDRLEELRLITEKDPDGTIINLRKSNQVYMAIKYENYTLKYEIKIPFKKADNLLGLNIDLDKEISVGFVTNKPELKEKRGQGTAMPDENENSPRGGGMNGFGMRGSPGAGMGSQGVITPSNLDFWINVTLVK